MRNKETLGAAKRSTGPRARAALRAGDVRTDLARPSARARTDVARPAVGEAERLIHELEVHQIELEMQNVALLNAQADLALARDRFVDLYDFAPIAYLTLDDESRIREANLTAGSLLGIARRQLVGKKFEQFVSPEQQKNFRHYQRKVFDSAATRGCDLTVRRRDGSTFAARVEGMRIEDLTTGAALWRCVISDISERTRAEEALRARELEVERLNAELGRRVDEGTAQFEEQSVRLQAIVDTVAEGIITFDQDGIVDSINAAALHIFGYRAEEVRGRAIGLLVPRARGKARHDFGPEHESVIGPARAVSGRHRQGQLLELELSLSKIVLPQTRRFVAVIRDVSERRRLETQLRERQEDAAQLHRLRTAGELAGVLAHQLNQPLTAILGFAEAAAGKLRRGVVGADQLSGALAEIIEQAHRAANVIRDLRHFLSRERGEMLSADLNATARRVYELMGVLANDAGVALRLDLGATVPPVPMLKSQIEQVLLILIDNAIDAIVEQRSQAQPAVQEPAAISLSTTLGEGGSVIVTVRDTGPGLDEKRAHRVFDPLYTTKLNGVGLGLSIARSVIEAHGGRIWADPGAVGVFHFMLPVKQ